MRADRTKLVAVGFVGGAAAGSLLWTHMLRSHRHDLFSPRRLSRVAALGNLRARPTVGTAQLLREYVAWERSELLRKRAVRLLHRVEAAL
ncbi:MAG: hypothetical protein H0W63_09090 [Gemmatimonadaceae bacterium]|nr:hypothetical protein [Gemmatimonadaceae bacterium]